MKIFIDFDYFEYKKLGPFVKQISYFVPSEDIGGHINFTIPEKDIPIWLQRRFDVSSFRFVGVFWNEPGNHLCYNYLQDLFKSLRTEVKLTNYEIRTAEYYVKGRQKQNLLEPLNVIQLDDEGCPPLKQLCPAKHRINAAQLLHFWYEDKHARLDQDSEHSV